MPAFQLLGLAPAPFAALFRLSSRQLAEQGMQKVIAHSKPGYPCRIRLEDAEVGEELLLLPYQHQPADSPYRASGPIFVSRVGQQHVLPVGEIPDYVRLRLMSVRAYDQAHMMLTANVCAGEDVAMEIESMFADPAVSYIHLHNAKRGCFSCLVQRASSRQPGP